MTESAIYIYIYREREREERREDIRNTLYNMFLSESEIQIERIENEKDSKR